MTDAILRALWVSAILYMRSPSGRGRKDHCEIWHLIDEIAVNLGYPCAPLTAAWCQNL